MRKTAKALALLAAAIIILSSASTLQTTTVKAQTITIIVPDQYPTIQDAINNASAGDTIFVRSGIYENSFEGLKVTKPLTLLGENSQTTVLQAAPQYQGSSFYGSTQVISVTANNVTISGFTIEGRPKNSTLGPVYCGISVQTSNVTIVNNTITSLGWFGISIPECYNVSIINNGIIGNGVSFDQSTSRQYFGGIYIDSSSVTIHGNNITGNLGFGVEFDERSNCTIYNNNIQRNDIGIYLQNYPPTSQGAVDIYYNNFIDNNQSVFNPANTGQNLSWDNGKVGNYWSDYLVRYANAREVDTTGVGDTPYRIDEKQIDYYPLLREVDINSIAPVPMPSLTGNLILNLATPIVAVAILAVAVILALLYRRHQKTAIPRNDGKP